MLPIFHGQRTAHALTKPMHRQIDCQAFGQFVHNFENLNVALKIANQCLGSGRQAVANLIEAHHRDVALQQLGHQMAIQPHMVIVAMTDQCPGYRCISCWAEGLNKNTLLAYCHHAIRAHRASVFKTETVILVVLFKQTGVHLAPSTFVHGRRRQTMNQGGIIKSTLSAFG